MSNNAETLARVILEIERILASILSRYPSNKFYLRWIATMRSERQPQQEHEQ
jgi:hypothetical protein